MNFFSTCLMCFYKLIFDTYSVLAHLGESGTTCRISYAEGIFRVCVKRAGAVLEERKGMKR